MAAAQLCTANLDKIKGASPAVALPKYNRASVTPGIVHLGVGNFHRAHQCVFVDDALSLPGHESWGYAGIGLMPGDKKMQEILKQQDTMYTLWEKGTSSNNLRIMGCHSEFVLAPEDPAAALKLLSAKTTKIVTLTVTEKGYFMNLATGQLDTSASVVSEDIATLKAGKATGLKTAAGFLVAAAERRKEEQTAGFAILSCDNVQENGCKARTAVLGMADAVDSNLAAWIRENVTFPNSMVDRITPATTEEAKAQLAEKYKIQDGWPVISEDFLLWVIEDKFPQGRPQWEKTTSGKCIFVEDVVPYELMKLRLLNSVHQALSYPASLLGHELVHEAMGDGRVSRFLEAYMAAVGRTVPPVKGLDKAEWNKTVIQRFSNSAVRDTIFRLNEDATNRIAVALAPCLEEDAVKGKSLSKREVLVVVLPIACWIRCLLGADVGVIHSAAKLNRDERGAGVRALAASAWEAAKSNSKDAPEAGEAEAKAFLKEAFGDRVARPQVAQALARQLRTLQGEYGIEIAIAAAAGTPLKKPKFRKISSIKPEQRGVNFYGKVVKMPEQDSDKTTSIVLGDDSGIVTVQVPSDRLSACAEGQTYRVQNARIAMANGYVRVVVDKWAVIRENKDADVGPPNKEKDISSVEYVRE